MQVQVLSEVYLVNSLQYNTSYRLCYSSFIHETMAFFSQTAVSYEHRGLLVSVSDICMRMRNAQTAEVQTAAVSGSSAVFDVWSSKKTEQSANT